jgi:peptide chain release factor 1
LFKRLDEIAKRYQDLAQELTRPEVATDPEELQRIGKAQAELEEVVGRYEEYRSVQSQIREAEEIQADGADPEMKELAQAELDALRPRLESLEQELRALLLPKDPMDQKSVILEIRAGTGGDEAALFAGDLFRMYSRFAERQRWKVEVMSSTPSPVGGFREIICTLQGKGAYSRLKFESGAHRVQRVPATESAGRIHTSAATVAVLPEVEDVDVEIRQDDLQIDTFRASSAGGQHMQKNETAVRITHLPTGTIAACQDERSQLQNKEKAMLMLRAHIYEKMKAERDAEYAQVRKLQVGTGDRSEKIRTYNFPQGRITDHRIGFSIFNLEAFMDGDIASMLEALNNADQADRLQAQAISAD